jgi:CheY-like chemotaxis protein/rubrerythrin
MFGCIAITSKNRLVMRELIEWQKGIEKTAADFYRQAAGKCSEHPEIEAFLLKLASEEIDHHEMLEQAAQELLGQGLGLSPDLTIDGPIRAMTEGAIRSMQALLEREELAVRELLQLVVDIERSEWNDVFMYIMDVGKKHSKKFQDAAAQIQSHKDSIANFIKARPVEQRPTARLENLPKVWHGKVLLVDDEPALRHTLVRILEDKVDVEASGDPEEALKMIQERHFDVVVCDANMPVMRGIAFHEEVIKANPRLAQHFVYFAGSFMNEEIEYIERHGMRYLYKPLGLGQIVETVEDELSDALSGDSEPKDFS